MKLSVTVSGMSRVDKQTFLRFWRIAKPFFVSEMRWKAAGMILLLVTFSLSLTGLNVIRNFVDKHFMTALAVREWDVFLQQLYFYLLLFLSLTPVAVFYRFTEERFGLMWRTWLCEYMLRRYFEHRAYYRIDLEQAIDNPDQRLEEDVRNFTVSTLSFALIILNSVVALYAFIRILWSISWILPVAAVAYALIGSAVTYWLGRPLIGLNFEQLKKEANLRYKLVNVRDHSESIALYTGEREEFGRVMRRLHSAISNMRMIIAWNRNVGFFTYMYNYVHPILPVMLVAPLYLRGKVEFGVIAQAAGAFGQVLGALSIIVVHFGNLSSLAAMVNRLGTFDEALSEVQRGQRQAGLSYLEVREGDTIRFDRVNIMMPHSSEVLVRDLSYKLEPAHSLLICGPSGSGKSSVLRVLAGLWDTGSGTVWRPGLSRLMFLPQSPYLVLGSLRSQLYYPGNGRGVSDRHLEEILCQTGLSSTVARVGGLDAEMDWPNVLSMGEQQLIAFVRLMLQRPSFVLLDESTSAMDPDTVKKLYRMIRDFAGTVVSVGPREALEGFHEMVLELNGKSGWTFEEAKAGQTWTGTHP